MRLLVYPINNAILVFSWGRMGKAVIMKQDISRAVEIIEIFSLCVREIGA